MRVDGATAVGVLMGGMSSERDISIKTGRAMAKALRNKGYTRVIEIDVDRHVMTALLQHEIEVAVIALHGAYGEDGTLQGLLEIAGIPYTGTGVLGSAIAMNKVKSKISFEHAQVATPPWRMTDESLSLADLQRMIGQTLGYPLVCKPVSEGSTYGLSIVANASELMPAQAKARTFNQVVLWEKYIAGAELTVGFLEGQPLPVVEIVPTSGLFDFEAKYTKGKTAYFCPARLEDSAQLQAQDMAKRAFTAVGAYSLGRVDLIYQDETPWVLEVNTIPGMTETSLLPKAAAVNGLSFEDVVERILLTAKLHVGLHEETS